MGGAIPPEEPLSCDHLQSLPDSALISLWREGQSDALAVLYLRYHSRLGAFIRGAAPELQEADWKDLSQETWKRVAECLNIASHPDFFHFIKTIARYRVFEWWRKEQIRKKWLPILESTGVVGSDTCRYCEKPMHANGMCKTHAKRKKNGATEAEMRKPVRSWKRKGKGSP